MSIALGNKFKHSFNINQSIYSGFISLFKDNNLLHTNIEYAKLKGFKGVVMHGNILNGFLSYFIGECLPTKDVIILSQQINYNKPVYLNDNLEFEAEVAEVYESVNLIKFKFLFKNSIGTIVAKGNFQIGLT